MLLCFALRKRYFLAEGSHLRVTAMRTLLYITLIQHDIVWIRFGCDKYCTHKEQTKEQLYLNRQLKFKSKGKKEDHVLINTCTCYSY